MEFANRLTIAAQVKVLLLETVHQDLEFVVFTRKFMFSYSKARSVDGNTIRWERSVGLSELYMR